MDERRAAAALPALGRLGTLRERRALAALRAAEETLTEARGRLDAQLALVASYERELEALVERSMAGPPPTVESLRQAADRRGWLHYDLGKERYYIDGMREDVASAETDAAAARHRWLRERERGATLARHGEALERAAARRAEARADIDRGPVASPWSTP